MNSRKIFAFLAFVLVLTVATPARAWYLFSIGNAATGQSALIAEQIVPAGTQGVPASYGYDYIYEVLNTSLFGQQINGVSFFTVPLAGGMALQFGPQTNLPHVGGGWGLQFGPLGNPLVPFLTAEGNTVSPGPWTFSEADNRFPITGYTVHWSAAPGAPPLPVNRWTRLDLFSPLGPVPGSGVPDPMGAGGIGIDFVGGNAPDLINQVFDLQMLFPSQVDPCGTTNDPANVCSDPFSSNPFANITGAQPFGPIFAAPFAVSAPNPWTMVLTGLLLIGLRARSKRQ